MKKVLLLSVFFAFFLSSSGQTIERVFQVNNEPTEGNAVFPLDDGYLVLTNHNGKLNFTKFDLLGKPLFSKDFYDANGGWPHSAIRTNDGGYLIVGLREADRPQKGYIIKLSQSLAFEWGWNVAHIDPTVDLWVSGVRQTSDGGYIVLVKGQYFDRYTMEPFFGLVNLSTAGTLEWQRRIVATVQTEVFDVLQVGNQYVIYGGIYLGSSSNWDLYVGVVNDPDHGDSIAWQVWIGGLHFDGAYTIEPVIYPNASNLVQLDSNWIGLAAYTKSYGSNPGAGETDGNAILLILLDMSGTSALVKMLDGVANDRIAGTYGGPNLLRLSDGNLLLGGMSESNTYGLPGAYLVKLAPDLSSILWQHEYFIGNSPFGTYSGGLAFSLAETAAGKIAMAGKTPSHAFLTVLSGSGANEGGCTYQVSPAVSLSAPFTPDIVSLIPDSTFRLVSTDPRVVLTSITPTASSTTINLICYADLEVSPSPLDHDFGEIPVGTASVPLEITISNGSGATGSLVIGEINFVGGDQVDFSGNLGSCASHSILDPGESCKISVAFSPHSTGEKSTTVEIVTNDPNEPRWTGTIRGTGLVGQDISVSPLAVSFGDVRVGLASTQTITVQNVGSADLHLGTIGSPSAPFDRTGGTCANGQTLAPGGNCTIAITFSPQARGVFSSSFEIISDDPDSPLTILLSGTGTLPMISVEPPTVSFGEVVLHTTSLQTITIRNSGDGHLELGSIGSPQAPFSRTGGTCEEGLSLGHDESCTIQLAFTPTTVGSFSSTIDIASNDPDDPLKQVPLSGNGTGIPEISTDPPVGPGAELDFGKVLVGETSSKTFTIENVGTGDLVLKTMESPPPPFSIDSLSSTCTNGKVLTPGGIGASCTIVVRFEPVSQGIFSGSFTVGSNDSDEDPISVDLSGKGVSFLVDPEEGTLGTGIALAGSGFGDAKGKVMVGGAPLKILEWTSKSIRGSLTKVLPIDTPFDVVVQPKSPKGAAPITEPGAFIVRAPEITAAPERGRSGDPTPLVIHGNFFSNKKGKVLLDYNVGGSLKTKSCKVLSWPVDSLSGTTDGEVQFTVPKGLAPGTGYTLRVTNKVGSDSVPFEIVP